MELFYINRICCVGFDSVISSDVSDQKSVSLSPGKVVFPESSCGSPSSGPLSGSVSRLRRASIPLTIVTAVLLSAAGLAQESQNPPNQATPDQPSPGQVNPTQTSPAPTSPSQSQPDRSQPDQTPAGQTPPPDQSKPEPPIAAVATQAENAAIKSVQVFNLLEKKSIVFPDIASTTAALGTGAKFQLFVDNSISVHSDCLVGSWIADWAG